MGLPRLGGPSYSPGAREHDPGLLRSGGPSCPREAGERAPLLPPPSAAVPYGLSPRGLLGPQCTLHAPDMAPARLVGRTDQLLPPDPSVLERIRKRMGRGGGGCGGENRVPRVASLKR